MEPQAGSDTMNGGAWRVIERVAAKAAGALAIVALASSPARAAQTVITVSAAVSLSESFKEIQTLYHQRAPQVEIRDNFGGSGPLEQQIEQGAPVDVFASASPREMNALARAGLIRAETRRDLVSNEVVLVVPKGRTAVKGFPDLATPAVRKIAIAEPTSVPAGRYAAEVLKFLGLWDQVQSKLVFSTDVREALIYVETGNVDAGLVYETEARLSPKVEVVATAPSGSHAPIVYPVAVLKSAKDGGAAAAFVDFLFTPEAQAVFRRHGFHPEAGASDK
jgi:molybdate transport system substrate-binding protein